MVLKWLIGQLIASCWKLVDVYVEPFRVPTEIKFFFNYFRKPFTQEFIGLVGSNFNVMSLNLRLHSLSLCGNPKTSSLEP